MGSAKVYHTSETRTDSSDELAKDSLPICPSSDSVSNARDSIFTLPKERSPKMSIDRGAQMECTELSEKQNHQASQLRISLKYQCTNCQPMKT
jgi:hypothetical protein